jgi:hypothetical protein
VQRDLLELSDDREIVLREERMKILEDENRGLDLLDHLVQGRERIFGGGVAVLLGLEGGAGRNDADAETPHEHFLLPPLGDAEDGVLHTHFLAGDNVEDRVARADQGLNFRLEIHKFNVAHARFAATAFWFRDRRA